MPLEDLSGMQLNIPTTIYDRPLVDFLPFHTIQYASSSFMAHHSLGPRYKMREQTWILEVAFYFPSSTYNLVTLHSNAKQNQFPALRHSKYLPPGSPEYGTKTQSWLYYMLPKPTSISTFLEPSLMDPKAVTPHSSIPWFFHMQNKGQQFPEESSPTLFPFLNPSRHSPSPHAMMKVTVALFF